MVRKRLLLVGGGHAHLFVLEAVRDQAQAWPDGLEVTMVSSSRQLAYSGMLPGLVAGHYRPSECHIDLGPLARRAGVKFLCGTVDAIDLSANTVWLAADSTGEPQECGTVGFDILSLDVGGAPFFGGVPGAAEHAVPLKPTEHFLRQWRALQDRITHAAQPLHVVTVGGGPGGIEVALAMAHRMAAHRDRVKWSLATSGSLLPGYPQRTARLIEKRLAAAGIALRTDTQATCVEQGRIFFHDGSSAGFDALVWAGGAAPQRWIAASGLACVDAGFVHINDRLQSISHPQVFAAGDIATDPNHRRPKAGVFAVRQGQFLARNLLQYAMGESLIPYRPQRHYLSLLSTGPRHAVAAWNRLTWQGEWVWRWKDRIDRGFIDRFTLRDQ